MGPRLRGDDIGERIATILTEASTATLREHAVHRSSIPRQHPLQTHIPVLADHILAKASARLARGQLKARLRVDVARRAKHAVRPERHASIAAFARETDAFVSKPLADA